VEVLAIAISNEGREGRAARFWAIDGPLGNCPARWQVQGETEYNAALPRLAMSPTPEDLTIIKDDMIAFIEGHGMRRFHGYVDYDEVQCVMWETGTNPDGWKDFVELAKTAGAPFLTMHSWKLEREELDELVQRLTHSEFSDGDDVEDARWLRAHVGKVGFLQLGWAYQGSMFLCEVSTDWYERYQRLLEMSEDFGGIPIDESDQDDES
jgi:hypothetical protein